MADELRPGDACFAVLAPYKAPFAIAKATFAGVREDGARLIFVDDKGTTAPAIGCQRNETDALLHQVIAMLAASADLHDQAMKVVGRIMHQSPTVIFGGTVFELAPSRQPATDPERPSP